MNSHNILSITSMLPSVLNDKVSKGATYVGIDILERPLL